MTAPTLTPLASGAEGERGAALTPAASETFMPIVIVGHVDHGKSTVIGRLLADTGSLPLGKLEQVRAACERDGRPFEYAFLIDALRDERAQNITIDSARVFFKSARRRYIIIDAPGHIEFVKNMVTGASRAEAALLVIDAQEGVRENSRRHGYLLWMLGIQKIVVLVNKMDLVGYRQAAFEAVRREYQAFLSEVGVQPSGYLPVSGRLGDNIAAASAAMPWYAGPTVLEALDAFEKEAPPVDRPFRMPVQDVYKFTAFGDSRRIVAGRVTSGSLRPGDAVTFYPSGKRSLVKSLEAFNAPAPAAAVSGRSAGFTLEEQIYVQRGEIAARADQPAPRVTARLRASLLWLAHKPLRVRQEFWLKLGTAKVKAEVEAITRVIDAGADEPGRSLAGDGRADGREAAGGPVQINRHDVAECVIALKRAVAFDLAGEFTDTGRFVIVSDYEICGGGIVLEALDDARGWVREAVFLRNLKWEKSAIAAETRAERYNQRATLVLITGPRGVGRKKVAKLLEARLFESGKIVYYLAIGSVLYGVDADLQGKERQAHHQEHIRRLAEVAHILLDAGVILIVTAIELTQADLEIVKTAVDPSRLETVWIGDDVTTDIAFDLQLTDGDQAEAAAVQIKRRLQDRGAIFSP
jgi:bifunctional enzyme CysN/CysC